MNKFWVRLYNSLNCEIDAIMIGVPEGMDYAPSLREAVCQIVEGAPLEPGDSIKIEAV